MAQKAVVYGVEQEWCRRCEHPLGWHGWYTFGCSVRDEDDDNWCSCVVKPIRSGAAALLELAVVDARDKDETASRAAVT